jgi:ADP-ribose pyrophosphatase YjhB (NUDIX family)
VLLILTNRDHLLLALRDGTGYADGQWNLPSGKLEIGEDVVSGLIREAVEEVGVRLAADEPRMVATVHHRNSAGLARVGLVFAAAHDLTRHGEPINAEPHKCAKIGWFPSDMLPSNTYPYTAACVAAWRTGATLRLSGWH